MKRRDIIAVVFVAVFLTLGALGIVFTVRAVAAEPVPIN